MVNLAYDIFKRDAFGVRAWVEGAWDLESAQRRIIELSADSPGKYVVVNRASGQMVGGGTVITSAPEEKAHEPTPQTAKGTSSSRKVSSHAVPSHSDAESETLWR
jgi:hypothetical protein